MKASMDFGFVAALALSIAMVAAFLLLIAGMKLLRAPADRRRGALMIIAALVIAGNVLIWTWPQG
jgi:hypothetical protein